MCGDTGGVVVWGGDLGVVGSNGTEDRGNSCGVPETGDKFEKKSEGRLVAKDRIIQSASGGGDTTALDLLVQEAGDSGVIGGLPEYLQGMRKGDGLLGIWGDSVAMVETRDSRKTSGGHIRRDFGSSKGAAAIGIRQVWQGRGRRGEGGH